ncbi:MAG: sodium:solute symporter [Cyclobacteriaceae bacterium]|nr:sodium:solute symporter [Cyclobacteriaceae bacterium]
MGPTLILLVLGGYFGILLLIAHFTSRQTNSETYFTANRKSTWYMVAFGMIGSSLSGITFISVPGMVGNGNFFYFQMVLGYLVGYGIIAGVLLPLYYRLNLVSIYGYLGQRLGFYSHKTGSLFFLLSQSIGAALRLFVVAEVLQLTFFDHFNIPFVITVVITLVLIWIYTRKAGIKTIVYTDFFQTSVMLISVFGTIVILVNVLDIPLANLGSTVFNHEYSTIFNWDLNSDTYFFKQFVAGALVAIAMNGLDQNEMQKSLTCKNLKDAQKNILFYSVILVLANLVFLSLGVLLYIYVQKNGVALPFTETGEFANTDGLFPMISMEHLGAFAGFLFLLGIASAAFSSADSALTALTTAFYKDFVNDGGKTEKQKIQMRKVVNLGVTLFVIFLILIFRAVNNESVIHLVYTIAGYTYGPLLGMFVFGLFTNWDIRDKWVPVICVLSSGLAYLVNDNSVEWLGFGLGYTVLLLNAMITFLGLWLVRK